MNTILLTGRDAPEVALPWPDLVALASLLEGDVLTPGDTGWDDAVRLWNGLVAKQPRCVVRPSTTRDVAATVDFARDHNLLLGVRCGGHNIGGAAIPDGGIMLDLSGLRTVEVDPDRRLAHVGGGCLLRDVDRASQAYNLATTLGFVSEVGVGGLTLGGGFGYLARRFGWAVDNFEEVEVVTADGQVRVANREEHPDLFWAVRGGGGNFGVVTRITLRLHPVGPTVFGGLIAWPFERAEEVMAGYRRLTETAPRELTAFMVLMNAPPAPFVPPQYHGRRTVAMTVCYSGDLSRTEETLAPLRELGEPAVDLLHEWPYVQQQSYLDETEPKGHHYYWRTEFASGLDDRMLTTFREAFASCPVPLGQVVVAHVGGALNERAWDDGAVGNRDVRFVYGTAAAWEPGDPRADEYVDWTRTWGDRLRPFSTGSSYVNFQTPEDDLARLRASYGANWDRLVATKQKYDPGNVFRSNRNIPPW
ncbi:MAG TPA: FAD-binding oxidoreductase [Nocardioidaceae bacterium]|nr:FAD-binding oxidoreductase [Nocardioidaceae bacterium]